MRTPKEIREPKKVLGVSQNKLGGPSRELEGLQGEIREPLMELGLSWSWEGPKGNNVLPNMGVASGVEEMNI